MKKLFFTLKYAGLGIVALMGIAETTLLALCEFPVLYSTAAKDWLRKNRYPANLLSGIKNPNVRFYDSTVLGNIALFHAKHEGDWRIKTATVPDGTLKTSAHILHRLTEPRDLLAFTLTESFSKLFADAAHRGDPYMITIQAGYYATAIGRFVPLSSDEHQAVEMFAVAHELRHTDQAPPQSLADVLRHEGEADTYATQKVLENTRNDGAVEAIQAVRSFRGVLPDELDGDVTHATGLYIAAARVGEPGPDAEKLMESNTKLAAMFSLLAQASRSMQGSQGDIQSRMQDVMQSPENQKLGQEALATPYAAQAMTRWAEAAVFLFKKNPDILKPHAPLPLLH